MYDPLLRLAQVSNTTTVASRFLYDGQSIIGQATASGTFDRRYVLVPGSDEVLVEYKINAGTKNWKLADERGSVIASTDGSGNLLGYQRYDEYGIPSATNSMRYQYTGQVWLGEIGMYYYKARMYSPTLGRFMQTDPIGYGDGINWYNYVGGDPVNFSDPTGLEDYEITITGTRHPKVQQQGFCDINPFSPLCTGGSVGVPTPGSGSGSSYDGDITITGTRNQTAPAPRSTRTWGSIAGTENLPRSQDEPKPPVVRYPKLPTKKERCALAATLGAGGTLGRVVERVAARAGLQLIPGVNVVVDVATVAGLLIYFGNNCQNGN